MATPEPRSYTPKHLADRILAEQAAMESRGAADGEWKTITALFADIKGSVEQATRGTWPSDNPLAVPSRVIDVLSVPSRQRCFKIRVVAIVVKRWSDQIPPEQDERGGVATLEHSL